MTPTLTTIRLRLPPIRAEDAPEMAAVLADPRLYLYIGGTPPTSHELTSRYRVWAVGSPRAGERWHNWMIRLGTEGLAIGHLQATVVDGGRAAEIAWLIGVPWQGCGYATEAALALVAWLEASGVEAITAYVHPDNLASSRVASNAGLAATGKIVDGEVAWRREVRLKPAY